MSKRLEACLVMSLYICDRAFHGQDLSYRRRVLHPMAHLLVSVQETSQSTVGNCSAQVKQVLKALPTPSHVHIATDMYSFSRALSSAEHSRLLAVVIFQNLDTLTEEEQKVIIDACRRRNFLLVAIVQTINEANPWGYLLDNLRAQFCLSIQGEFHAPAEKTLIDYSRLIMPSLQNVYISPFIRQYMADLVTRVRHHPALSTRLMSTRLSSDFELVAALFSELHDDRPSKESPFSVTIMHIVSISLHILGHRVDLVDTSRSVYDVVMEVCSSI